MSQFRCDLCETTTSCEPYFNSPSCNKGAGIVRCSKCGLIFYPLELVQNTHSLYTEKYFEGGEYASYKTDQKIHEWNFKSRIRYLQSLCSKGSLFEIGSAYGFFLHLAKQHWEIKGIEISMDGVNFAHRKLGISPEALFQGDLLKTDLAKLGQETFDLVCLWDTLEHLDHPKAFLKKAYDLLMPGGHLVLTTLDSGSFLAKTRKEKWRQVHPPTHLYYFDRPILKKYVEALGYEWVEAKTIGVTRSYRSMLHGLFAQEHSGQGLAKKASTEWIYRLLTLGERIDFPIYLNTGDLVQITAKKPH